MTIYSGGDERGFSLLEVVVATVIAVLAVLGLAHSFGVGRGLIDRFASARDAVALTQRRLEMLSMLAQSAPEHADLAPGTHGPSPVRLNGLVAATEEWDIAWVDDPLDGTDPAGPDDYKRITVTIRWSQAGVVDQVQCTTLSYPQ